MSTFAIKDYAVTKTATQLQLIINYVFDATDMNVYANLLNAQGEIIKNDIVYIPPEVYAAWTVSDSTLIDYVAQQLGVTLS